jgi:cytochrome c5
MNLTRNILVALACVPMLILASSLSAQQPSAQPKGAELVAAKCAQCHTSAMWQDQRQDARAWEANLYRMVVVDNRRDQADGRLPRH